MSGLPDCSVRFGHLRLKNPVMPASGTFGYAEEYASFVDLDLLGAIVIKTITMKPRIGSYPYRSVEVASGLLASIGLQNVGIERFIEDKLPFFEGLKTPLIVNIGGESTEDYVSLAKRLDQQALVRGIELNVSCPNVRKGGMHFGVDPEVLRDLVSRVRQATGKTLMVKLTPVVTDIRPFAEICQRQGDEYRDVLPLLGKKHRTIAMDTIGFGDSYRLKGEASIEVFARGVIQLMDALTIQRASIIGHHTGGVVAVEVAAAYPDRVEKLILSSTPYVDAEDRERRKTRPPIDEVEERPDGSHLTELWQRRMPFYPESRPDLLRRFVLDALKVWDDVEAGHRTVNAYRMEERVPLIKAPTLVLAGTDDPFSYPRMRHLSEHVRGSRTAEIQGGMVPMPDQMPEEFAAAVMNFLDSPQRR